MSTPLRPFCLAFCVFIPLLACAGYSQAIEATIDIPSPTHSKVGISGSFVNEQGGRRNLSFVRSVAGIEGLPNRIADLLFFDSKNAPVTFRQLAPGEYLADRDFTRWSYTIDLTPNKNPSAAAHISWYANGTGILMLMDLLPILKAGQRTAKIKFKTPDSLTQHALPFYPSQSAAQEFLRVADTDDAVFYFGGYWDSVYSNSFEGDAILSCCGWHFEPVDVSTTAKEIYNTYLKLFGSDGVGKPTIAVAKFPQPMGFGNWEAETRGNTVTIISSDMPFRTQSIQRLHEQLRHELFHLWIPNDVNLTGKYDWFYEGFALYESLKLAVGMNRIRFADFLDTLSRAHTIDSAGTRQPLLEASTTRFNGSNTQVYARGMLVAFLVDLTMLENSKGKRSVEDLLRELYQQHKKPAAPADGNTSVINILKANGGESIVAKYVSGSEKIEWTNAIATAGIEDADPGPVTTLRVNEKLTGRQKTLLDKLGYNNWRKLSPSSK